MNDNPQLETTPTPPPIPQPAPATATAAVAKRPKKKTKKKERVVLRRVGQPTKYKAEYSTVAYELALIGFTDIKLAEKFNISLVTFYKWIKKHKEFKDALYDARVKALAAVSKSMYQRAVGCSVPIVAVARKPDGTTEDRVVGRRHFPPDGPTARFILTNRAKDEWQEKTSTEHTGPDGGPLQAITIRITSEELPQPRQVKDAAPPIDVTQKQVTEPKQAKAPKQAQAAPAPVPATKAPEAAEKPSQTAATAQEMAVLEAVGVMVTASELPQAAVTAVKEGGMDELERSMEGLK